MGSYVVPVALTRLQYRAWEAKGALPSSRLGCIFRKRKLTRVVIPWAEQMSSLDINGSAKSEWELSCRHYCWLLYNVIRGSSWVFLKNLYWIGLFVRFCVCRWRDVLLRFPKSVQLPAHFFPNSQVFTCATKHTHTKKQFSFWASLYSKSRTSDSNFKRDR